MLKKFNKLSYCIVKKICNLDNSSRLLVARPCSNSGNSRAQNLNYLSEKLNVSQSKAEYILLKNPTILKLTGNEITYLINLIKRLGISQEDIAANPKIFSILPSPIQQYWHIYKECGFADIRINMLCDYLRITKTYKIRDLKAKGYLSIHHNVSNNLINCFENWPISRGSISNDDESTILEIRMKILQRYLELILDLPQENFERGLKSYPRIKHRSFHSIKQVLGILQDIVLMPVSKIKNNLFLLHADPENLKQLIFEIKKIASVDIKEILRAHPVLCNTNYETFVNTERLLKEFNISEHAQSKCFEIYSLGTETVKRRLKEALQVPDFKALMDHPRVLRLIYYRNNAVKRLNDLNSSNKKCTSLHLLSCSTSHYKAYEKSPGDRTKGKDLVFGLSNEMNKSPLLIKNNIKRHPFWINIPLVHAKSVYNKLIQHFSVNDIFQNSIIILYQWKDIQPIYNCLKDDKIYLLVKREKLPMALEHLDVTKLTNTQVLSLILYFIERRHYFSGNGVWIQDRFHESTLQENRIISVG